ncbi:MAG: ATP-binding cassette domain-containing protein [Candidatus Bathyarchaeota archaeon]|nr:MAG: ATP-binding cassette domain-containing protein [Candidatus Bathyarchaeota archaeon]
MITAQSGSQAISVVDLVKRYEDVTAVDGLSFDVHAGEIFGLLGPNGAGKTTTINILCGLLEPTSGEATVLGFDVQKEPSKIKERIGVCPQEPAYFSYLTGRENIELIGNLHCMERSELKERTDWLLKRVGLGEGSRRRAGKYSGGMIRRMSLVMALVNDPEIAFLDEPTVGLDPQSRRATWELIRSLKEKGSTVILTTHYIEEAEALADRVGIIDRGKLIALDTPQSLMEEHGAENLEEVFIKITGRRIREEV